MFGPSRGRGADRGLEALREGGDGRRRRARRRRCSPTPRAPCVLKADGLAAGKGVVVCRTEDELEPGLATALAFGDAVVVEELLDGPEVSMFALCDGVTRGRARPRRGTSSARTTATRARTPAGMGSFAPVPAVDADALVAELVDDASVPVLAELARRGAPFVGTLFAGLMLTPDGPRVLEYNCRFGDPETQSVLPLVDGDLLAALAAAAPGSLDGVSLGRLAARAVTVVLAAGDYPAAGDRGAPIEGIDERRGSSERCVFHAGTALRDGRVVTNGGRLLGVTATGQTLSDARATRRMRRPTRSGSAGRAPSGGRRARGCAAARERSSSGAPQPTTRCQFYRPYRATMGADACATAQASNVRRHRRPSRPPLE